MLFINPKKKKKLQNLRRRKRNTSACTILGISFGMDERGEDPKGDDKEPYKTVVHFPTATNNPTRKKKGEVWVSFVKARKCRCSRAAAATAKAKGNQRRKNKFQN